MEGGQTQAKLSRGFILLLLQAAALPGSDAGSNGVEPNRSRHLEISDFVLHVVSDVWDTLLRRGLRFVQCCRTRNAVKKQDPICAWTNRNAHQQSAVDWAKPKLFVASSYNRPSPISGYQNFKPGGILTILCAPSMIRLPGSIDA